MSLQATLKRCVGAVGRLPLLSSLLRQPSVRGIVERLPGAHALYGNAWDRTHPFDRAQGIDTSGFVPVEQLSSNATYRAHATCYAGSQPGVLRTALAALPPLESSTFLDLGCGKGRALLVASEYPFRAILGVEMSPALAGIARRNATVIAQRFPQRSTVRVEVADASNFPLPPGDLVVFMYHPFGAALVARVVAALEAACRSGDRSIYVIYYNPVAGHLFDASPVFHRHYARMIPYATEELGYGPDDEDPVVIWRGGHAVPASTPADARIEVLNGMRVRLVAT